MTRLFALACLLGATLTAAAQEPWDLRKCVEHAFEHNLTIRQAALGVQTAEIGMTEARGQTLPNLNGQASHGYNWGQTIDPFTNTFATERIQSNNFGLSTGMTLFNGLRTLNTIRQSDAEFARSQADLATSQNAMALTVATAYLTILLNEEFYNVSKANVTASQQQVDRIRTLVEAGQLPEGNLADIEAQLYLDEANMIQSENQVQLAYLNLTQLLQLTPQEAEQFEIARPDLDALGDVQLLPDATAAVAYAVQNFPQIRSAETGVLSAEYGMAMAKAGRYPSLFVNYSYGTGYSGARQVGVGDPVLETFLIGATASGEEVYSAQFTFNEFETKPFADQFSDNLNQSLFFSLQVPIFNRFQVRSQIQRAEIGLQSAALNLEQQRQTLSQDVERAYADARAARKTMAAAEKALGASQTAFEYAEVRFEEGVSNVVDYNAARIRRDNAQADFLRSRYDYIFKAKVLDFYMGQPINLQ